MTAADFPERIRVVHTYRPTGPHDLYVLEPPHERGTEYLRADHVAALLAEERRKALKEAAQIADAQELACARWVLAGLPTPVASEQCAVVGASIRALSDAPAREVTVRDAALLLVSIFDQKHKDLAISKGRNPYFYTSHSSITADSLRALSQGGDV